MVLLFLREHKGAKNYFPVPNKWGDQKFDHSRLLFVDEGEHFISFVMQNKFRT